MRRRNSVSLRRHIVWLTSSLRTSTKSFGSVTVISPRVNIGDSFVDIATNDALLGQRQANAKQMELEHSDTLQQPPVSVGEPYDGIEFNTRLAALRLIQANIAADEVAAAQQRHNHHQITKRRNNNSSETETEDSGAACSPSSLEFNTVNAMWNVASRRNSDEHHHHECDEAECGSGGSAHASPPVVPATNNRQRQVMHTNTNNNQRSATASSKLKGWQCHVCGALFLNSLGDGRRTVCSVCITPRAESSLSSSSLSPSSTSGSFETTWKCEHCTEINEVYVEAANKESEASNLTMMMNFPAAPAHLARSGGGDIGGDSTGKACRCCGFRRGCPSFSNATFLTAHPPRTSKQISASDISPSMAYMNSAPQFENPDTPFLASSSSSTDNHLPIIERVIDRLIRWHCFTCSFGNLQHTLECAKCGTHKGTTAVVCSHCNLDEDVTIADIVAQRPCPRCHKSLHGAYRKGSTSIWVCTCGTYGKGPTCHRCRAPRTLPTSPPSLARQYTTRTNNLPHHHTTNNNSNTDSTQHVGESSWNTPTLSTTASSAFDYVYLTSWACAQCSTVNKASYRQRRRISLMSPQPNRNALRGGGGGGGGETSATTSLGLESERGRDATDSSVEIIRGQLYCGGCRLPWHGAKVSGGQAWRCACHHVNLYNDAATTTATAASGGTSRAAGGRALGSRSNEVAAATNICKSCGRSENITSATTVSFWQPGDWQCQKCFRHNYRRRSKCDCGEHQPF